MRKFPKILVVLLLTVSMLCGCSQLQAYQEDQVITVEDLTISLPRYFENFMETDTGLTMEGFFLYGYQEIVVTGVREDYSLFETVPSLEEYANLLITNNDLNTKVEIIDGLTTFTFAQLVDEDKSLTDSYTYVAAVFAGTDAFWMVQAGCRTMNINATRTKLIEMLKTVKVA